MDVLWTAKARADLLAHIRFIAQDDPDAAARMNALLQAKASGLGQYPLMGRNGRVRGTRELLLPPHYILAYIVREDAVYIVSVLHAARRYPPDRLS